MRKFLLLILVGAALALVAPQSGSAAPAAPGVIAAAADNVSQVDQAQYRRWHHRWGPGWRHRHWGWRHRHWGWRHRHWGWYRWHHRRCWHRRYWSGLRCRW